MPRGPADRVDLRRRIRPIVQVDQFGQPEARTPHDGLVDALEEDDECVVGRVLLRQQLRRRASGHQPGNPAADVGPARRLITGRLAVPRCSGPAWTSDRPGTGPGAPKRRCASAPWPSPRSRSRRTMRDRGRVDRDGDCARLGKRTTWPTLTPIPFPPPPSPSSLLPPPSLSPSPPPHDPRGEDHGCERFSPKVQAAGAPPCTDDANQRLRRLGHRDADRVATAASPLRRMKRGSLSSKSVVGIPAMTTRR